MSNSKTKERLKYILNLLKTAIYLDDFDILKTSIESIIELLEEEINRHE